MQVPSIGYSTANQLSKQCKKTNVCIPWPLLYTWVGNFWEIKFFIDPTVHFIGLKRQRLAVGVLSLCTELSHCDTRRWNGSQFLYSIYLCDSLGRCCVTLVNLGLRILALYIFTKCFDRLNTYKNTYCPNFKTDVFLSQRTLRWFRKHFRPFIFKQKRTLRRRFLVTKFII
jgi:hypothetical protein